MDKHAKRHARQVTGVDGRSEMAVLHLGKDHCATSESIRAAEVLNEKDWKPYLARACSEWTPYHGLAKLAKTGFEPNAYCIKLATYEAWKKMMMKEILVYSQLTRLDSNSQREIDFTPLKAEQLYI
ncbi:hypothetical protein I316_02217 [Kwoniella heveanensis BCC8398]|uniref:Uncharacterized protein n=1 Tax=Kwoniella heveanensis BCC8398 TaxID=1296120 RepID=A0A1B9GZA3_9TREE|nr:hypothetical protein I316_02217 [Kwoniella heveanensis BCC8398]